MSKKRFGRKTKKLLRQLDRQLVKLGLHICTLTDDVDEVERRLEKAYLVFERQDGGKSE
jgi:hypothetical protein